MSNGDKLEAFFEQKCIKLDGRVGVSCALLVLKAISAVLCCMVVAVMCIMWAMIGLPKAIAASALGLVLGMTPSMLKKLKRKPLAGSGHGCSQDDEFLPIPAKYLLCLFLPKKDREPLLGDMEEEYHKMHREFGERAANLWLYKQVLMSLWPMLQTTGRTLAKWGLLGWLEEVIRRIAH